MKAVVLAHTSDRKDMLAKFIASHLRFPRVLAGWKVFLVAQGYDTPPAHFDWDVLSFPEKIGCYSARMLGSRAAIAQGAERLLYLDDDIEFLEFSSYQPLETILDTVEDAGCALAQHGHNMGTTLRMVPKIGTVPPEPVGPHYLGGGLMYKAGTYIAAGIDRPGPQGRYDYLRDDYEFTTRVYLSGFTNYRSYDALVLHKCGSVGGIRSAVIGTPGYYGEKPRLLPDSRYVEVRRNTAYQNQNMLPENRIDVGKATPLGKRTHRENHIARFGY